jgi:hypothetical protein
MHDIHTPGAVRAALQYVLSNDLPSDHKSVLIALLTQALRDEDVARLQDRAPKTEAEWRSEETQQLQTFLDGKIANSWQHADELLMRIAGDLRRSPYEVRKKATEIGLAAGIDYSVARTHPRPQPLMTTTLGKAR